MYVRMTTVEIDPGRIDTAVRFFQEVTLPQAQQAAGWEGMAMFVDRERGVLRTVAYWSSREALEGSMELARKLRGQFSEEAAGGKVTTVEEFEVALRVDRSEIAKAA